MFDEAKGSKSPEYGMLPILSVPAPTDKRLRIAEQEKENTENMIIRFC